MNTPRGSHGNVGRWGGVLLSLLVLRPFCDSSWAAVQIEQTGTVPILRVNVVARSTKAVNYRHRAGATKVDFAGTALQPKAHGEAKVETKKGYTEIEVEFDNLEPANKFGPEFLTYVLWAVSPEGRASNLGEILLDRTADGKLNVTTELQAFGMIVTAEPYFAVTQPSDVVVMENIVRPDTKGKIEEIEAKYELLQRGEYTLNVDPSKVAPIRFDPKTTLPFLETRMTLSSTFMPEIQTIRARRAQQVFLKPKTVRHFLVLSEDFLFLLEILNSGSAPLSALPEPAACGKRERNSLILLDSG